jgi:RNA polymerase-binding protein DksA
MKERLETDLRKAKKKLQQLEKRLAQKPEFGLGDGSTSVRSRELALARKDRVLTEIEKLQAALVRVREGTYGRCERCGTQIDPERLEVLPTTTLCVTCAQATGAHSALGSKAHP